MVVASCAVERDEAVVVAAVHVDEGDDAGCRVDEVDDARCRLTHVRVMTLEVLASCIYRLEMISPCQAETPIRPRPGCMLQLWSPRRCYLTRAIATDRVCLFDQRPG